MKNSSLVPSSAVQIGQNGPYLFVVTKDSTLELRQVTPGQKQPDEPYAVSILKSGVVDGMAYTLYSDGSIEAEMPHGTMRFASIVELRAYLDRSS